MKMREVLYYRIWPERRDYGHILIPAKTKRRRLHGAVRKAAEDLVWSGPPPDEIGYYAEVPPGEFKHKPERFHATDTTGNVIKRFGAAACLRVMQNPVNFSATDPLNYALVYCPTLGIGIYRWGHKPRKAKYVLYSAQGHSDEHAGIEGRDYVIAKLLRMVKTGKMYFREHRSDYAHEQIPPWIETDQLRRRIKRLSYPVHYTGRQENSKRKK